MGKSPKTNFTFTKAKLHRPNTNSNVTIQLPHPMHTSEEIDEWASRELPGWYVINAE